MARQQQPDREPSVPVTTRPTYDGIVALTDKFCQEHLNAEYEVMCRKLTAALARKRPSPITRGKPETWACAIVRVVGWVNYLEDRSQPLHMTLTSIDQAFGVAASNGNAKAKAIRDLLKIRPLDPNWTLPSQAGKTPAGWLIHAARKGFVPLLPDGPAADGKKEQ
jgi:hypothetical protein